MGDSLSAMHDDYNDYIRNCKFLGIKPINSECGGYHMSWVDRVIHKQTYLPYEDYVKNEEKREIKEKILSKQKEISRLENELSMLD